MEENSEIIIFIKSYKGDDTRLRFAGKVAEDDDNDDFNDPNEEFRTLVLKEVLAVPERANVEILRDLFRAETEWATEALCVSSQLNQLAFLLLNRGRASVIEEFLEGRSQSFDTHCACGGLALDPELCGDLLAYLEKRFAGEASPERKEFWQDGIEFVRDNVTP